ncbi:MAG: hypothetical protein AAFS10_07320, partial [Myxococcota bacterium]
MSDTPTVRPPIHVELAGPYCTPVPLSTYEALILQSKDVHHLALGPLPEHDAKAALDCLAQCTFHHLETLVCYALHPKTAALFAPLPLPALRHLDIDTIHHCPKASWDRLLTAPWMTQLITVRLHENSDHTTFSGHLRRLAVCTHLERLTLKCFDSDVTPDDLDALEQLPSLKHLTLMANNFTPEATRALLHSPLIHRLEHLSLELDPNAPPPPDADILALLQAPWAHEQVRKTLECLNYTLVFQWTHAQRAKSVAAQLNALPIPMDFGHVYRLIQWVHPDWRHIPLATLDPSCPCSPTPIEAMSQGPFNDHVADRISSCVPILVWVVGDMMVELDPNLSAWLEQAQTLFATPKNPSLKELQPLKRAIATQIP